MITYILHLNIENKNITLVYVCPCVSGAKCFDVTGVWLQGAVSHLLCRTVPVCARCRAIVRWNIFYISSNGFSLLIN